MAAETIAEKVAKTIAEEVAEKAAETMEAVAEVTAETVAEEMAENVTKEEAETEIVSVKAAETKEVVKRDHPFLIQPSTANLPMSPQEKWAKMGL